MTNRQIWPEAVQPVEALDFEQVDPRYLRIIIFRLIFVYLILIAGSFFIFMLETPFDAILVAAAVVLLTAAFAVNIAFVKKIYGFKGYALRDNDISYRSGIFCEATTTIPYSKIQQVSTRMNIVSRLFGLRYVDVINGAQDSMSRITIPGLTEENAEQLKTYLISRTGCDSNNNGEDGNE